MKRRSALQMPEKSTFPLAVRGVGRGAEGFVVRATVSSCATRDAAARHQIAASMARDRVMVIPSNRSNTTVQSRRLDPMNAELSGRRLGVYQLHERVGAGGMGEVYRARDTRLQRDVAVKILPEAFAADGGRRARFEREALVLASLNHPNIATIHGIEDQDGIHALVMELVDGETLADRILRGALPVSESLAIARQIADALDAAHERGIVHRDLKPANIKLTSSGLVKVLEFGLAKAAAGDDAGSEPLDGTTVTAVATQTGGIVGTPAYMSPEQTRGQPVDKRADIWAFGCVLYEMIA